MKNYFLTIAILLFFSVSTLKAQKMAVQDNNQFITVVQTPKTIGRLTFTHYTLTNSSTVSMDFTLYKETKDGTWLTTHSLNLNPGQTFDDESSANTLTGRYVVYSAPHSDWASFPSFRDIAASQGAAPTVPTAPATPPAPVVAPAPVPAPPPAPPAPVPPAKPPGQ